MKNKIKFLAIPVLLCSAFSSLYALPTLSLEPRNGTCVSDCQITATANGAVAPVTYVLIDYPNIGQQTSPQTSNIFAGLMPGTYKVGVYDATTGGTPVIATTTVSTSYVPLSANQPVVSYPNGAHCGTGTMAITFSGGKSPFRIKITNIDSPYNVSEIPELSSAASSKTATFSGLLSGRYIFEIQDACDQWQQNVPGTYVTLSGSAFDLNGTAFTGLTCTTASTNTYIYGTTTCGTLYIYYYYSDLRVYTSATNYITPNSNYPSLKFRVNYPAGSNNYTAWVNGYSMPNFTITNYDRDQTDWDGTKYIVQVQHPCSGAITSSPAYTIREAFTHTESSVNQPDYCTVNPTITVTIPTTGNASIRNCMPCYAPYTVTLKNGTGTTVGIPKTITATQTSTSFNAADGVVNGNTYSVEITGSGGAGYTQTISPFSVNAGLSNFSSRLTYYTHNNYDSPSYVTGYNYQFCDYNTTGIYAYMSSSISGIPVTYSIVATGSTPTITRSPITSTSGGSIQLWTDIPWGTYDVTADYGCGTFTRAVTLTQTVTGFKVDTLYYAPYSTVCTKYSISGRAFFHKADGTSINSTHYAYSYYMLIVDGPAGIGSRTYTWSSPSYTTTISDLPGGTYKVIFYPYRTPTNNTQTIYGHPINYYPIDHNCLIEKTLVIPEYDRPIINIPLSGGISCPNPGGNAGTTELTVTVGQGSRPPFVYRYKQAGAPDITYTPESFQTNNVFPGLSPGNYTVQVKDQCGSITTQDVRIFDGRQQFVGIIGEIAPGVICRSREVTLSVLSIGPVRWYKWYYSADSITWNQLPSIEPTYVIASAQETDKGYYRVRVYNGLCELESGVRIIDVIPPAATPSISGPTTVCTGESTTLTAVFDESIVGPFLQWYKNGSLITGANSATYTAGAGTYRVSVTPYQGCVSDLSSPHTITEGSITPPVISPASNVAFCKGDSITLTATPNYSPGTYRWYKDGNTTTPVFTSSASNTYSVKAGGAYTVTVSPGSCTSGFSTSVTVAESDTIAPSVVISAAPGFEVCLGTTASITFTATPGNGGTSPTYVWKIDGATVGNSTNVFTLTNLEQYRKSKISCTMTSSAVCPTTTTATDEKDFRISPCVIPVNPHIRGNIK